MYILKKCVCTGLRRYAVLKNSFSTMDDMLYCVEQTCEDSEYGSSVVYTEYVEILKVATEQAQKSIDAITNQFEEVYR